MGSRLAARRSWLAFTDGRGWTGDTGTSLCPVSAHFCAVSTATVDLKQSSIVSQRSEPYSRREAKSWNGEAAGVTSHFRPRFVFRWCTAPQ